MKVKAHQDATEAIKAGIEPVPGGTMEIEITLADLTPQQRTVLAANPYITVIRGDAAEVVASLQALVDEEAKRAAEDEARRAQYEAEAQEWLTTATTEQDGYAFESGIKYSQYKATPRGYFYFSHKLSQPTTDAVDKRYAELQAASAERTAQAKAAVQAEIDAARAKMEEENRKEKEKAAAFAKAKYAKRLETGIVEISWPRDDRREWGEPWIAKLKTRSNGRKPEYDFSEGSYDLTSETLSIPCKPGEVIAYGQKNYRKPKHTAHKVVRMEPDGRLTSA